MADSRGSRKGARAWAVLVGGVVTAAIVASILGAIALANRDAGDSRRQFEATATEVGSTLRLALQHEEDLVVSEQAFVAQDPSVSPARFAQWVRAQRARERYPELQGIGMAMIVPRSRLQAFAARLKTTRHAGGSSGGFKLVPPGSRPFYCILTVGVIWNPPNAGPNSPGPSLDACPTAALRAQFLADRDSGATTYLAFPLPDGETAFTVQMPAYRGGLVPRTIVARRRAFIGMLGQTINPRVVLARALQAHPGMALALRHRSEGADVEFTHGRIARGQHVTLDLGGGWSVRVLGKAAATGVVANRDALALLIGGILASLLLGRLELTRHRRALARAEQRVVRESEERLDALLHNSSDMITVVTPDGTVLYQAGAVPAVLGQEATALEGDNLARWIREEDLPRLRELCETSDTAGAELDLRHADGSLRACEVRATSLLDHPAWAGVVLNIRDVSDRKRLEIELRLAQKLESVGQLAAGIAHEINTPIQFISDSVGYLDGAFADTAELLDAYAALRDAAALTDVDPALLTSVGEAEETADLEYLRERVPAALERSRDGLARVSKIVGAVREFGQPAASGTAPLDINAAIENTLVVAASEYRYVADLTTDLGDIPPVRSNGGDLNQVLINLIVNASHAIADTVAGTQQRGRIHIASRVEHDHAVITIADTGGGIPADIANRVFDPFFTTKAVGRGTGQGLSIARTIIIDRHDGQLTFTTRPGDGTTFTIRLPLVAAVATPAAA